MKFLARNACSLAELRSSGLQERAKQRGMVLLGVNLRHHEIASAALSHTRLRRRRVSGSLPHATLTNDDDRDPPDDGHRPVRQAPRGDPSDRPPRRPGLGSVRPIRRLPQYSRRGRGLQGGLGERRRVRLARRDVDDVRRRVRAELRQQCGGLERRFRRSRGRVGNVLLGDRRGRDQLGVLRADAAVDEREHDGDPVQQPPARPPSPLPRPRALPMPLIAAASPSSQDELLLRQYVLGVGPREGLHGPRRRDGGAGPDHLLRQARPPGCAAPRRRPAAPHPPLAPPLTSPPPDDAQAATSATRT